MKRFIAYGGRSSGKTTILKWLVESEIQRVKALTIEDNQKFIQQKRQGKRKIY